MQLLLDAHFPEYSPLAQETDEDNFIGNPEAMDIVTEEKIKRAIFQFKPFKQPGQDGIYPVLLQRGFHLLRQHLIDMYTASLELAYVPKSWRVAKVAFLPKPGKGSYQDPKSFRPISMTSFMLKTLERLVCWHVERNYFTKKPIHSNQWAFKPGGGTLPPLHKLVEKVERTFHQKEIAVAVFLDIRGAFDNISVQAIGKAMRDRGWPKMICSWITNMLSERLVTAFLDGYSVQKKVNKGSSQGGVSSVMSWNIDLDPLLERLEATFPQILSQAFADDLGILISGRDQDIMIAFLQQALRMIEAWAIDSGLSFNHDKCEVLIFSKNRKVLLQKPLYLNGTPLKQVDNVRYLGVWLDEKLTWKVHCGKVVAKATNLLFQVRRALGKTWGLGPSRMDWVYKAVILPAVTYAASIWIPAMEKITYINKIKKVQRLAAVMTLSAYPSTPTDGLLALLSWPQISLECQKVAVREVMRLKNLNVWTDNELLATCYKNSHTYINRKLIDEFSLEFCISTDAKCPRLNLGKELSQVISGREEAIAFHLSRQNEDNCLHVYTDGSKNEEGKVGAAFAIASSENRAMYIAESEYTLRPENTVYQAEVYAIKKAAQFLLNQGILGKHIYFWSDSQAGLNTLNNTKIKSKLVDETLSALYRLTWVNKIRLRWIPGHCDIEGNERADQLAKGAVLRETIAPDAPHLPSCYVASKINKKVMELSSQKWSGVSTCRQTKESLPAINKKVTTELLRQPRSYVGKIVQLMTGHSNLKQHQYRCGRVSNNLCDFCMSGSVETPMHFLGECPRFASLRCRVWGTFYLDEFRFNSNNIAKIKNFLNITKRLD